MNTARSSADRRPAAAVQAPRIDPRFLSDMESIGTYLQRRPAGGPDDPLAFAAPLREAVRRGDREDVDACVGEILRRGPMIYPAADAYEALLVLEEQRFGSPEQWSLVIAHLPIAASQAREIYIGRHWGKMRPHFDSRARLIAWARRSRRRTS